jgi:hypothetical protein
MATVRKRVRIAANGEEKIAWVADYHDQHKVRHLKTFPTRKAAAAWLVETQGEVSRGPKGMSEVRELARRHTADAIATAKPAETARSDRSAPVINSVPYPVSRTRPYWIECRPA